MVGIFFFGRRYYFTCCCRDVTESILLCASMQLFGNKVNKYIALTHTTCKMQVSKGVGLKNIAVPVGRMATVGVKGLSHS